MHRATRTLAGADIVRGRFTGDLNEPGVAAGSRTETFVALRLPIDPGRWQGVSFFIRAGKKLPLICTEVLVRLKQRRRAVTGHRDLRPPSFR